MVLTRAGLDYTRFVYYLHIKDDDSKMNYLQVDLTPTKLRHLASKSFIDLLASAYRLHDVRYILPSWLRQSEKHSQIWMESPIMGLFLSRQVMAITCTINHELLFYLKFMFVLVQCLSI